MLLDQWNERRTPAILIVLRYENRKNFQSATYLFVEFWNAYNRENIETYYWEDRVRKVNYFNFIPVGGLNTNFKFNPLWVIPTLTYLALTKKN